MADTNDRQAPQAVAVISGREERKLLAPLWHTAVLVLILFASSAFGYFTTRRFVHARGATPTPAQMIPTYAFTLVFEWVLFFFVFWGERRYGGATLRERIGGRWARAVDVWRDIGSALGLWVILAIVIGTANQILKPQGREVVFKLLPTAAWQLIPWIVIAASAGFCEEYVFRGYLMEQFKRLTGVSWLAIVLQAAVFGFSHGYQGWALMFSIFLLGTGLGITAHVLKNLRAVMITHAWIDTISGIGGFLAHHFHVPI